MWAMITKEADSLGAMRFRMRKADGALWLDMENCLQKLWNCTRKKHKKFREVVQPCILHSCEGWSWNKQVVDALRGWESRDLDLTSSRKWIKRGLSLEWFRANEIRMARKRFAERGGDCIEWLMPQRIWWCKETIFDKKRTKQTDQMMRGILMHANKSWSCAHELGQPHDEMESLSKMVRTTKPTNTKGWDEAHSNFTVHVIANVPRVEPQHNHSSCRRVGSRRTDERCLDR